MIDQDEQDAINELMKMNKGELMLVNHDKYKMECAVIGCKKYWNVFDFGISPMYFIRKRFYDLSLSYYCEKHFKIRSKCEEKEGSTIERLIKK